MIQIIGLLPCVYLVFKGVEIFQLALTNNRQDRTSANIVGILSLLAAIGLAALFAVMLLGSGADIPNR